jgi:hypothetical protein
MPGPKNKASGLKKKGKLVPRMATPSIATNEDTTFGPTTAPVRYTDEYILQIQEAAKREFEGGGDQATALHAFWEIAFELGKLAGREEGFKEGKNKAEVEKRQTAYEDGKRHGFQDGYESARDDAFAKMAMTTNMGTQTDTPLPATCTCVDVGIGLDAVGTPATATVYTQESIGTQTVVDNSTSTASTHFSWADDAAEIPIASPLPLQQAPRDFSALRSGSRKPFSTLQRRYHRSRGVQRTCQPFRPFPMQRTYGTPPIRNSPPLVTHYHPSGIKPGKSAITIPIRSSTRPIQPALQLDWDQDPRLCELGRVLGTLGWVRRCQFV